MGLTHSNTPFFCSRMPLLRLYVWKESDLYGAVFLQHCECYVSAVRTQLTFAGTQIMKCISLCRVMAVPATVIYFTCYDQLCAVLKLRMGDRSDYAPLLAGAIARGNV